MLHIRTCVHECSDASVVSDPATPRTVARQAPLSRRSSPGTSTGVSRHVLLQGIFPTQGSNPHLLHWQEGSLLLHRLGVTSLSNSCTLITFGGRNLKEAIKAFL